jgi:hypothetical protein
MSTFKPVAFNPGAPLDADLLTQLQSNLTTIYAEQGRIKNQTKGESYTIKSDCGRATIKDMGGNNRGTATVNVPEFTSAAIVVVTPASNERTKEQITINVRSISDGQFVISGVSSDKDRKELGVTWNISEQKRDE